MKYLWLILLLPTMACAGVHVMENDSPTFGLVTMSTFTASSGTVTTQFCETSIPAQTFGALNYLCTNPTASSFGQNQVTTDGDWHLYYVNPTSGNSLDQFDLYFSTSGTINGFTKPVVFLPNSGESIVVYGSVAWRQQNIGFNYVQFVASQTVTSTKWVLPNADVAGFWQSDGNSNLRLGPATLNSLTHASITALTPSSSGVEYYCSDCATVPVCISTGTALAAFSLITNKGSACQ